LKTLSSQERAAGFFFLRNVLPEADQAERLPAPIAILSVIAANSSPALGAEGKRWTVTWLYRAGHCNKFVHHCPTFCSDGHEAASHFGKSSRMSAPPEFGPDFHRCTKNGH
jgi:hypothetical protein